MDSTAAPTKKDILDRLLGQGMVMVHVDARREGVEVPADLAGEPDLRLNLSYRFAAGDLTVGSDEVRATLSFSGHPFTCTLPMDAVYAMVSHVSGEGFFFPGDAPPEALAALAEMSRDDEGEPASGDEEGETAPGIAGSTPRSRPVLRAIDGGADAAASDRGPTLRPVAAAQTPASGTEDTDASEPAAADEARAEPPAVDEDAAAGESRRPPWLRVVK